MTSEHVAGSRPSRARPAQDGSTADGGAVSRSGSRRLRADREVRAAFQRGHSAHTKCLSVYAVSRPGYLTRTTVVAGRKVGGAVRRNRAKRRLRAALQACRLPEGYDVVVVARGRCLSLSFPELRAQVAEQIRRSVSGCEES